MFLTIFSAFTEVLSLGAIIPFIGVLTAPEHIMDYAAVRYITQFYDITSADQLILPLTIGFSLAALLTGFARLFLLWTSSRVAFTTGADISIEVYKRTLYQPYLVHIKRNSSEVISGISQKTSASVSLLYMLIIFFSSVILLLSIITTLIVVDPVVALTATALFGITYVSISVYSRGKLFKNSQAIAKEQSSVVKILQEGLGSIRDVLLDGTQPVYCEKYFKADLPLRQRQASNMFIIGAPRYFMESFGIMLIALLAYVLSKQEGGVGVVIPTLGALALGAQRMLPALQNCYSAWSSIVGNQQSLIDTLELLRQPIDEKFIKTDHEKVQLKKSLELKDISFRYDFDGDKVLEKINFKINKGQIVGIVGSTGSGKSTTLDILMGLLPVTEGDFCVDGIRICGANLLGWQKSIAHVPQSIYLSDATIAENIALGVDKEKIDMELVKKVAIQAQAHDFIIAGKKGYDSMVGEWGVRLSGGQRQRIGIARALYKNADVLVLDEATSALDNSTEKAVMEGIHERRADLTIIMIAHRLSTIMKCDMIIELQDGKIKEIGTYNELLANSESFRHMASYTSKQ